MWYIKLSKRYNFDVAYTSCRPMKYLYAYAYRCKYVLESFYYNAKCTGIRLNTSV